ncbi:MAG: hypothetical protein ISR58_11165 [Anaerolineales bacterium]|nr:hypothetical protein [Chloroflexota bacterium]MBL6981734.1 hypothetical protein [Anaerolineales bacterium]
MTGLLVGYAQAQSSDENTRFFPETGHTVSGAFLEKYNSILNGEEIYGYPITDAFEDDRIGYLVQYFEKARFELHPENSIELQVQLTPLGDFLYQQGELAPNLFEISSCKLHPETGFEVCYDFLDFFEANGGIIQFGYPISGIEIHDGWFSQYFQRVRLEWHPEHPQGEKITVADLGIDYFNFQGENTRHLQPNQGISVPIQDVSRLQVHAFVSKPILSVSEATQTLYIIVYDQNYKAAENVFLNYMITLPSGGTIEGRMTTQTDRNGLSYEPIRMSGLSIGTAEITVTATVGTIQQQTQTSFQIW